MAAPALAQCQEHHGADALLSSCTQPCAQQVRAGTIPRGVGQGLRGTCAARVAHWAFSGWSAAPVKLLLGAPHAPTTRRSWPPDPASLLSRLRWSPHLLPQPGLGSWPAPQGALSSPRRKLWAFLVLVPLSTVAEPAAGVRGSPASGAKSRLAMGHCLGGFTSLGE